MATEGAMPRWYRSMRAVVFALLAFDTGYYLFFASLSKGLDAAAWLLLLALFAYETKNHDGAFSQQTTQILRGLRIIAVLGIAASGIGYVIERDTLDAINTALWIAVVCLLEVEVRRPREVAQFRAAFAAAAAALYGSLALLVVIWAWRTQWLDAYDALLWLVAFAAIEMDVLGVTRTQAPV